ncbi:TIM44 subunit of mitochondria import inner membrane translocase [Metschnikowia bicuspidata]|uniref:Mitochondrial import inner membrane translocase subunit TIM44 n=1 Tax=Metschnikowia bicuspidata TaxID=27322 RepID=A0A4P9ZG63_9ASCO|nr:TIM44 subunit of mitochondria import inner membrane translocase [Metschnikowia bicuspidata]
MLRQSVFLSVRALPARAFTASAVRANAPKGKSPMQVFFETFKDEVKKSNELKQDIKALQDETGRVADSEAFKKAKEAYDRAQRGSSAAGKIAKQTVEMVGDVTQKAWESPVGRGVRTTVRTGAEVADKAFEPVRKTQLYKDIGNVIDDGSSTAYGGYLTKEQREALRQKELELKAQDKNAWKIVKENTEAGGALVRIDAKPSGPRLGEKWEEFKSQNPVGRGFVVVKEKWDESENGLVSLLRAIFLKISWFFSETEQAQVVKRFRRMDPSFRITDFTRTLTNYIVPEILEAYVTNDQKVLKKWFSPVPYESWGALHKQIVQQGLFSDSRILDIRGVEVVTCKILEPNDIPVIVASCRAQEIHLYRDAKTGEIKAGAEDHIQMSTYAMVFTRVQENMDDEMTEGWTAVEFVRGGSRPFH